MEAETDIRQLTLGFSPCPNDTFIFCGLVNGRVDLDGWSLQQVVLEDVETLNEWALQGRLDVSKLSFHALGHVLDEYVLLHSGAALGRGCGPLLVAREKIGADTFADMRVAIPGKYTTAAMLLQLYAPTWKDIVVMRFDEIMPAIEAGKVDCGVIIHESRFTYMARGLALIADLGSWWEGVSGHPIPLGGIVARRSLGQPLIAKVDQAIKTSIVWAQQNRQSCLPYIKKYAQELEDSIIDEHIGLYVNAFSENLGADGLAAVDYFLQKGRQARIFPESHHLAHTI